MTSKESRFMVATGVALGMVGPTAAVLLLYGGWRIFDGHFGEGVQGIAIAQCLLILVSMRVKQR